MTLIEANDGSFQDMIQTEFAVVDYYGDHCAPCKLLAPNFEKVASEMDHICFIKLNVEHNPETAKAYEVTGIPRLMFFRNGEAVADAVGYRTVEQLHGYIAEMLYQ